MEAREWLAWFLANGLRLRLIDFNLAPTTLRVTDMHSVSLHLQKKKKKIYFLRAIESCQVPSKMPIWIGKRDARDDARWKGGVSGCMPGCPCYESLLYGGARIIRKYCRRVYGTKNARFKVRLALANCYVVQIVLCRIEFKRADNPEVGNYRGSFILLFQSSIAYRSLVCTIMTPSPETSPLLSNSIDATTAKSKWSPPPGFIWIEIGNYHQIRH
jgi:hypothetical protein